MFPEPAVRYLYGYLFIDQHQKTPDIRDLDALTTIDAEGNINIDEAQDGFNIDALLSTSDHYETPPQLTQATSLSTPSPPQRTPITIRNETLVTMILIYLQQVVLLVLKQLILKLLLNITFLQKTNVAALVEKDVEEDPERNLNLERDLDDGVVYPNQRYTL